MVLIDYMGPNIRLGLKVKKKFPNIPIIYYIAPQEWAWSLGDGGSTDLIGFTDKILAIFRLEEEFYKEKGGNVSWVGHPMIDTLKPLPDRASALDNLDIPSDQKLVLLFPASRPQETRYLMSTLTKAALLLQAYDQEINVLVPSGLPMFDNLLQKELDKAGVSGRVIPSEQIDRLKPSLFAAADLALTKSGTINMELALNGVPQIVGYKVSRITSFLARKILRFKVDHISPVNLLLKRRLLTELVQKEFTPESIFRYALPLLEEEQSIREMQSGYKELKKSLGEVGATNRAAREILDLLNK